ncbi:MAG TPA: glycosyltransferase family 1 protein [Xanthobacteraceae bacterium]|jgi:glycosyltransferase involved in cell wall biosynthesis
MPSGDRIVFDLSSIARWTGPAVGIARVEHALATHALTMRPDIVLSIYDSGTGYFHAIEPAWAAQLVDWSTTLEILNFDYRRDRTKLRNWLPSRYWLLMLLERVRLTSRYAGVRRVIDRLQRLTLLSRHMPMPFADRSGRRLPVIPAKLAVIGQLTLGRHDIVVSAGFDWYQLDADKIGALKRQCGFRYVVMCYDIIPLLFPEFYAEPDVVLFRRHWDATFRQADRVLVNSRRVEADVRAYCAGLAIRPPEISVVPLGYPSPPADAVPGPPLPGGLEDGRFVLFVATIEPRKGHRMLIRVWRRLLAAGIPQRLRFKLAFVGRRGWMVDDLFPQIDELSRGGTLVHLADVSDSGLIGIYRACAFCVYPSLYEGFGLPIVEAFSFGKAVIASTGGAVPETANGLAPCLDPTDEDAWFRELERWIKDGGARAPYEARVRQSFSHPDWESAAAQFFEAARG